jgi:hypothetical protein
MAPPTNVDPAPQPSDQPGQPQRDGEERIMFLEREQLVRDRSKPVAHAHLGRSAGLALWALRIVALVVSAMVIYTFIVQLN